MLVCMHHPNETETSISHPHLRIQPDLIILSPKPSYFQAILKCKILIVTSINIETVLNCNFWLHQFATRSQACGFVCDTVLSACRLGFQPLTSWGASSAVSSPADSAFATSDPSIEHRGCCLVCFRESQCRWFWRKHTKQQTRCSIEGSDVAKADSAGEETAEEAPQLVKGWKPRRHTHNTVSPNKVSRPCSGSKIDLIKTRTPKSFAFINEEQTYITT